MVDLFLMLKFDWYPHEGCNDKSYLKHFRKVFRLFIFGNFLLCNEVSPLIADSMLVLSEMFKTLLVVLLADKDGLTEGSILNKNAHKEYWCYTKKVDKKKWKE